MIARELFLNALNKQAVSHNGRMDIFPIRLHAALLLSETQFAGCFGAQVLLSCVMLAECFKGLRPAV